MQNPLHIAQRIQTAPALLGSQDGPARYWLHIGKGIYVMLSLPSRGCRNRFIGRLDPVVLEPQESLIEQRRHPSDAVSKMLF